MTSKTTTPHGIVFGPPKDTLDSKAWWRGHENLGTLVLGTPANGKGEATEGETMRKAKRSEAV
jgi:hypothetical protein